MSQQYPQIAYRQIAFFLYGLVAALLLCWSAASQAQTTETEKEIQSALKLMDKAAIRGPQEIPLTNQAHITLPENFAFIPRQAAERFLRAIGNTVDQDFIGLIIGKQIEGFVTVDFSPEGYIKDNDAKNWNVDELLENLKEGTRQANIERARRGIPAMEVVDWIEKPAYDANTHRLVWSISTRNADSLDNEVQGVNYNTYLLGREGYLSLNLVTDTDFVEKEKPIAKTLLAAVSFNTGNRYEDFDASTDRTSEFGLAALIGGGLVAKKVGLLAVIGAFLLKAWKLILIGFLAFGAVYRKFLQRKRT